MTATREQICDALLTQLQTAGATFKTYSRRWKSIWDDPGGVVVPLPLLVLWDQDETVTWGNRGIGGVQVRGLRIEIYAKLPDSSTPGVKDATTPGSTVINPLVDAVFAALLPNIWDDGQQTLGGLVTDCRIEGNVQKAYGDEDPSGLCGAIIPVRLLIP